MTQTSFWQSLKENDYFIWFIALLLSIALHIAFLIKTGNNNATPSNIIKETITHARFSTLAPPPAKVVKPVIIKKPEPKPKPKKKPEKKKKPKKKVKKPEKPRQKKPPFKRKPPREKQKPVAQPTNSQNTKPVKTQTVSASPVIAKADPRLIQQTRTSYLSLLMRRIEACKHYPRVARKRKIEGNILVSFTLLPGGKIKNLQVIGKRSILKKASKDAVNYALPLPLPPKELSLPMEIKFKMNYFLR